MFVRHPKPVVRSLVAAAMCLLFGIATSWAARSGLPAHRMPAYPVGDAHNWNTKPYLVGSYSHFDAIFPARGVPHSSTPWNFRRESPAPPVTYEHEGHRYSLDDYLSRLPVTGLLIGLDDRLLVERYGFNRTDRDRFTSASMAKSVVALLLGIASSHQPHFSLSESAADFVPELARSPYGQTSILNLLHMESGVFTNDGLLLHQLYSRRASDDARLLAAYHVRPVKAGTHFHYSCADSEALGQVVRSMVSTSLADYFSQSIWLPIGTEQDASWSVDTAGEEVTCFGINATLRDWGRLARLLASNGDWNGQSVIPRRWLLDATTIPLAARPLLPGQASERFGYGYQLWILPGNRRMFALIGADGQFILVDPASRLYMVQTAVAAYPSDPVTAETISLWQSLVHRFGR